MLRKKGFVIISLVALCLVTISIRTSQESQEVALCNAVPNHQNYGFDAENLVTLMQQTDGAPPKLLLIF